MNPNFEYNGYIEKRNDELIIMVEGNPLTINDIHYNEFTIGEEVEIIVRPEMIQVRTEEGKYSATIKQAAYLGESIEYILDFNGNELTAHETDPSRLEIIPEGSSVKISFMEDCLHILKK